MMGNVPQNLNPLATEGNDNPAPRRRRGNESPKDSYQPSVLPSNEQKRSFNDPFAKFDSYKPSMGGASNLNVNKPAEAAPSTKPLSYEQKL